MGDDTVGNGGKPRTGSGLAEVPDIPSVDHRQEATAREREEEEEQEEEQEEQQEEEDDDDYIMSDEEENLGTLLANSLDYQDHFNYTSSLSELSDYLSKSLSFALESLQLDKSLVIQAQLSGQLNNENQKIIDKQKELKDSLLRIQQLYAENFAPLVKDGNNPKISKVSKLAKDIKDIETRIERLKNTTRKSNKLALPSIFKSNSSENQGVAGRFPVEYNQAKDKVLERQIDSNEY